MKWNPVGVARQLIARRAVNDYLSSRKRAPVGVARQLIARRAVNDYLSPRKRAPVGVARQVITRSAADDYAYRGKRATVDNHTQRGRWLRLPRKACWGRELWCTRYNRDRDTLFNSVLIHCFKSIYNVHEFFVQPGTIDYTLSSHRWSVFNHYSVIMTERTS